MPATRRRLEGLARCRTPHPARLRQPPRGSSGRGSRRQRRDAELCPRFGARERVGGEGVEEPVRQGAWLQSFAIHADEHHPSGGAQRRAVVSQHVEVERHGLRADVTYVRRDTETVVQTRGPVELAMDRLAGEEDVVAVEDLRVSEAAGTEQLRFGDLKESYVGAVEDDAREVHVGPADILLDDERCGGHRFPAGGTDREARRRQTSTLGSTRALSARYARWVAVRRRAGAATAWCG